MNVSDRVPAQAILTIALAAVCLSGYGLYHLSTRLDSLEARFSGTTVDPVKSSSTEQDLRGAILAATQPRHATAAQLPNAAASVLSPTELLPATKRTAPPDPAIATKWHEHAFADEPSLPVVENQNEAWFSAAITKMADDAPQNSGLQTSCRGRRCLVNATFADDGEARSWATLYLLAAGGGQLKQSVTIIRPLGRGPEVALQLYLY